MMLRRHGLALLATLVGLVFLAVAARNLDGAAVVRALAHARLWPWLPLGLASYAIGHRLRGLRLRRLVSHEVALTPHTSTNVVLVGYAMNNVLPARLGEVVRAWLLMERSGLSIVQTLTITLVERLLDALVLLALFGAATALLPVTPFTSTALPVAAGLLAFTALVLALGAWAPGPVLAFASRAANRLAPRAQDAVMRQVHAALGGLEALRHARAGAAVLGWSLMVWIAEAGLYLALLPAFGLDANPLHALFAMTGTNLGLLLPSTPGFVGPFHFFCTQALAALGVPRELGFGYAVMVHAAFFVPVTIYGVAVLASHGLSVGRAFSLSRAAEPLPAGAARLAPRCAPIVEAVPSRFVLALTEAAVPVD
ncbi:MAG: lysylphosphatidylglycerol synthase transmembrane domain-containing protein, partial [Candidatus Eisenbacteria bacterium]